MAKWLGWIDNAGARRPLSGPHSVEDVVSHKQKVTGELKAKATLAGIYGELLLDTRSRERTGASRVEVHKGDLDYYVVLRDHTPGKSGDWRHAAASRIEQRHRVLRDGIKHVRGVSR